MEIKKITRHQNGTIGILYKTAFEELCDSHNTEAIKQMIAVKEKALLDAENNAEFCKGTPFGKEEASRAKCLRRDIEKLKQSINP